MTSRSMLAMIVLVLVGTGAILVSNFFGSRLTPEDEMLASRIAGTGPSADVGEMNQVTKGDRVTIGRPTNGAATSDRSTVE